MMAMGEEHAVVLREWPQPAVVAESQVRGDEHGLWIRYRTPEDQTAVVYFSSCTLVMYGAPNDEAMGGHPLYGRGLEFYSVHEVKNSSLIEILERRNSVHPRHRREDYLRDKRHYVFTFQDATLECVVNGGEWARVQISVCEREEEVERAWGAGGS